MNHAIGGYSPRFLGRSSTLHEAFSTTSLGLLRYEPRTLKQYLTRSRPRDGTELRKPLCRRVKSGERCPYGGIHTLVSPSVSVYKKQNVCGEITASKREIMEMYL